MKVILRDVCRPRLRNCVYDLKIGGTRDVVIFTDNNIDEYRNFDRSRFIRIAWVLESPGTAHNLYNYVWQHQGDFDVIFTCNDSFIQYNGDTFVFVPATMCQIPEEQFKIYDKIKNISMIASNKDVTEGHRLRLGIARCYGNRMDLYGHVGSRLIYGRDKVLGMGPYRYSVSVENIALDSFFTEKLLDCFATGTVPIYWGTPKIKDYFDMDGIIQFSTLEEFGRIINGVVSEDDYNVRIEAIRNNFNEIPKYRHPEDYWLWKNETRFIEILKSRNLT